jgi:phosphate transport system substrate-binding protein
MNSANRRLLVAGIVGACLVAVVGASAVTAGEVAALRLGGSTTLLPIVATAASDFMEKYHSWDKVDRSLPAEPIVIFVTGGGSSFGVKSTLNGTVDAGMVSREIKTKEVEQLGKHEKFLIGKDAVTIATNKKNPLSKKGAALSSAEVARIFSGEAARYRALNPALPDKEIVLLVRDSGAGSTELMQELVMKDKQISKRAVQLPSQGALLQRLQANDSAVAYISSGLVAQPDSGLHGIVLDGVAPSNANVINGKYKLARPLYLVAKGEPSRFAQAFVNYLLADGQKIVEAQGYVPARTSGGVVAAGSR